MINNEYDASFRSVKFLYDRAVTVLKEEFGLDNFFCPDLSEVDFEKLNFEDDVNVLLFGSFVRSFFELNNWPIRSFKIWVLSSCVKDFLVKEFLIDSESISVIPRDKILEGAEPREIDWSQPLEFVYAGRLNDAKNIQSVIYTVHHLQHHLDKKVSLTLIGESDNQEKVYVEYKKRLNFKEEIDSLINKLDWKEKPKTLPFQEQDKWLEGDFNNPVYITLSTNLFEDYGVSVQQALGKGWPVIASAWGGHLDIKQNFYRIPFSYLTSFKESQDRGEMVASLLLDLDSRPGQFSSDFFLPKSIKGDDFRDLVRTKTLSLGNSAFSLMRSEWNELFFSKEGIQFINRYRASFREKDLPCYDVIVISDYYNSEGQFPEVESFVSNAASGCVAQQRGLLIFSHIELCSRDVWEDIVKAERIHLGIKDFKRKLASSYARICEIFEAKDIVVLDE